MSTRRRSVDPVADDKALGERFVAIDFELSMFERDLDNLRNQFVKVNERIKRLMAERKRIEAKRVELNDDRRTVERLRANAAQSRGM